MLLVELLAVLLLSAAALWSLATAGCCGRLLVFWAIEMARELRVSYELVTSELRVFCFSKHFLGPCF